MKANVNRYQFLAGATLLALLAGGAQAQTPKDTVVMAKQIDDIITLDPAEAFEFSGVEVGANVYDKLIGVDLAKNNELVGELAQSWTVSPDNLTYTFKLRPGVKFHSGNPLTAADVVYSFQRAVTLNKSPGFILTQFGFTKDNVLEKVKATDDSHRRHHGLQALRADLLPELPDLGRRQRSSTPSWSRPMRRTATGAMAGSS